MRQNWLRHAGKTLTFTRVFASRLHYHNAQKSWLLSRNIVRKSLKSLAPYYEAPIRHESCQTTALMRLSQGHFHGVAHATQGLAEACPIVKTKMSEN
jgi:hypothetical protein